MNRRIQITKLATLLVAVVLSGSLSAYCRAAEGTTAKFALLVGCSEYQHLKGANLRGPKNDVREFAQTLEKRFGFPAANIRKLVSVSPDEKDALLVPTRANILRELEQLAADAKQAGEGAQIVIAFSGHGLQVPIPADQDPLDPKNPELDGLDEAFAPVDTQLVDGEMKNLILDNELGECLQKIRAHGANVWALFDCCHSGTIDRSGADNDRGEVSRGLLPEQVGVSKDSLAKAKAKAEQAKARAPVGPATAAPIMDAASETSGRGTLVAFYAAQPFERAPDLACPATAPKIDSNYFGLLTYSTLQMLLREQTAGKITYRELGQAITGRYRAERGTGGPTPSFSGDLDHEVLGLRSWPGRSSITLEKTNAGWGINIGTLNGISAGSVLAVTPVNAANPIGHVRVVRATPTSAEVEPCEYEKLPAPEAAKLQAALRCEIVSRQLGDLRLSVAVPASAAELQAVAKLTREALLQSGEKLTPFVQVAEESAATWQLRAVTPAQADKDYGLKIDRPQVLLIRRGEERPNNAPELDAKAEPAGRIWRQYDPSDAEAFRMAVVADLQKVFTWQNLWRVAGTSQEAAPIYCDVQVEVEKLSGPDRGPITAGTSLSLGDKIELRVANAGIDRVWVTIVHLDADFRVMVEPTVQLNRMGAAGAALEPLRFEVSSKTPGPQGFLVIASSAEKNLNQPNYQFLNQRGLGKAAKSGVSRNIPGSSPFEQLALAVAGQEGNSRGDVASSPNNPTLVLRSWTISPPETAKLPPN